MSKRPPFLGYNHNVRHKGRLFHVQTEDSGLSRPVLTTHVFVEGTILATLRAQYTTDEPDPVVQKRMQDQHKVMLKRVRDGEFDQADESAAQPVSSAEPITGPVKPKTSPRSAEAVPESILPENATEPMRMSIPAVSPISSAPVPLPSPAAAAAAAGPGSSARPSTPVRKPVPPPPPQPSRKDAASSSGVVSGFIHVPSAAPASPPSSAAAGGPTAKLADRSTAEIARPGSASASVGTGADRRAGESTQEILPVAKAPDSSALAARLGIAKPVAQGVVPPPIRAAVSQAAANSGTSTPLDDEDIEPVVEMEVATTSDDDEPSVTIEAAEPTEEEAEAAELSKATPLPVSVPLVHDDTFMMGAEALIPPVRTGPFTVSLPYKPTGRVLRGTRPLANRPLHSGTLRARPTSEGVVVWCLGPALAKATLLSKGSGPGSRPSSTDPLRTTQPHLRPTMPVTAPYAAPAPLLPASGGDVPQVLDEKLLAFLRREAAR